MSTARKGQLCLVGFLLSEVALYLRAFANPSPGGVWVWEGPASLLLLIAGLGLLSSTNRRWAVVAALGAVVAALGAGGVGLLCTVPLSPFPASEHRLEVRKSEGKLLWYRQNSEIATFRAVFGPHPQGDKELMGDGRTPEGRFVICDKAPSMFHKWLGLSYPDSRNAWKGRREGLLTWAELVLLRVQDLNGRIPYGNGPLGGAVGIHGGGAKRNWTLGCVALENEDVDRLYSEIPLGTPVEILP